MTFQASKNLAPISLSILTQSNQHTRRRCTQMSSKSTTSQPTHLPGSGMKYDMSPHLQELLQPMTNTTHTVLAIEKSRSSGRSGRASCRQRRAKTWCVNRLLGCWFAPALFVLAPIIAAGRHFIVFWFQGVGFTSSGPRMMNFVKDRSCCFQALFVGCADVCQGIVWCGVCVWADLCGLYMGL